MIIETGELREQSLRFVGEAPAAILDFNRDAPIKAGSPVRYDLAARRLDAELLVQGTLEVELACVCARCAEGFTKTMRVPAFVRAIKLSAKNESIDLTADMREDILLALPMIMTCAPDCKGLCPHCGANLNREACKCGERTEPAFDVLAKLKLK